MNYEYWEHDTRIKELLFETNSSLKEMALDLGVSETTVSQRIKMLGLDWVSRRNRKMSRGQAALMQVLNKLVPGEQIINEYGIGEKMRLDIYLPRYKVAVEYHGRQHFDFVPHFHKSYDDFLRAQERDDRKIELCKQQGITIIAFRYCDELTEDAVFDRLLNAIQQDIVVKEDRLPQKPKYSQRNSPRYQEAKMKQNAFQRDMRRKIKQDRKERDRINSSFYEDVGEEAS